MTGKRFDGGSVRSAGVAAALALALGGCSGGGGGDPDVDGAGGVPVAEGTDVLGGSATGDQGADVDADLGTGTDAGTDTDLDLDDADPDDAGAEAADDGADGIALPPTFGTGGLGTVTDDGQPADDEIATNPFQTGGGGRPADDPTGADDDATPAGGGLPFGGAGVPVADDGPETVPADGAVLARLRNGSTADEPTDFWFCSAPDAPAQAVGYGFFDDFGVLVVVPDEGETETALFTSSEDGAGSVVNAYGGVDVVETMSGFGFSGDDAFSASSDLVGRIDCERFLTEDDGAGGGAGGGAEVSARVENEVSADGSPTTAWVCQGPRAGGDTVLYGFFGGRGVYVAVNEGEDPNVLEYAYSESSPGTLDLVYDGNGFEETLTGFAFASDTELDVSSSSDGALSCTLTGL